MEQQTKSQSIGFLEMSLDLGERHLSLDESAVGAEIDFEFRGQQFKICFPNFETEALENKDAFQRASTRPKTTNKNTDVKLNWFVCSSDRRPYGNAYINPKTNKIHRFSCRCIIVRSKVKVSETDAIKLMTNLKDWKNLFIAWYEVLNFQDLKSTNRIRVEQDNDEAQIVELPHNKYKELFDPNAKIPTIELIGADTKISSIKDIIPILKKCPSDLFPPETYLMLLDALRLYHEDKFRQSLFDSATAVEMALTWHLDLRLKDTDSEVKELLRKKSRQIRNLIEALVGLSVNVPARKEIVDKIANPRNDAIHRGAIVGKDQAGEALRVAKEFIYSTIKI